MSTNVEQVLKAAGIKSVPWRGNILSYECPKPGCPYSTTIVDRILEHVREHARPKAEANPQNARIALANSLGAVVSEPQKAVAGSK